MTEEECAAEKRRKKAEYNRAWKKANPEKHREQHRRAVSKWEAANPDKVREKALKRKYNITLSQYSELLTSQNFVCAICATNEPGGTGAFAVDHDHTTGAVRGILCFACNTGLGKFKDNPAALRQAAAYLEAAQCQSNISEISPSTASLTT